MVKILHGRELLFYHQWITEKNRLSVYKMPGEEGRYLAGETEVRFMPFGAVMNLTVEANQNGKPILVVAFVEGNVAEN